MGIPIGVVVRDRLIQRDRLLAHGQQTQHALLRFLFLARGHCLVVLLTEFLIKARGRGRKRVMFALTLGKKSAIGHSREAGLTANVVLDVQTVLVGLQVPVGAAQQTDACVRAERSVLRVIRLIRLDEFQQVDGSVLDQIEQNAVKSVYRAHEICQPAYLRRSEFVTRVHIRMHLVVPQVGVLLLARAAITIVARDKRPVLLR